MNFQRTLESVTPTEELIDCPACESFFAMLSNIAKKDSGRFARLLVFRHEKTNRYESIKIK